MSAVAWAEFDTAAVLPARRIGTWNELGSSALCSMSVEPGDPARFRASLAWIEFGPLSMISVKSTSARAMGGGAGWDGPAEDCFLVSLPQQGRCLYEQDNNVVDLTPGSLFFRDAIKPWTQTCREGMELLILKIPFAQLLSRIDDPARLSGRALSADSAHAAMTADIIRAAYRSLREGAEGDWLETLSDLVLDSLKMLYQGSRPDVVGAEMRKAAGLRREAMAHILHNLEDADLSVARIAEAMGISNRHLQRAFAASGESPSQFILTQRLDRAAKALAKSDSGRRASVLDIALSVGFNDPSHFSWTFKRRFGVSPLRYRSHRSS